MKALILLRTGSASLLHGSPSHQDSGTGIPFPAKNSTPSPRSALHFGMKTKNQILNSFRRSVSETDLSRSEITSFPSRTSIRSFPARIAEEEEDVLEPRSHLQRGDEENDGSLILKRNGLDLCVSDRVPEFFHGNEVFVEELEFSGGGIGKGKKAGGGSGGGKGKGGSGSGSFSGGNADQNKIAAYYQQMLRANPGNLLLLRNYGKFLHEVSLFRLIPLISRF